MVGFLVTLLAIYNDGTKRSQVQTFWSRLKKKSLNKLCLKLQSTIFSSTSESFQVHWEVPTERDHNGQCTTNVGLETQHKGQHRNRNSFSWDIQYAVTFSVACFLVEFEFSYSPDPSEWWNEIKHTGLACIEALQTKSIFQAPSSEKCVFSVLKLMNWFHYIEWHFFEWF